MEIIYNSLRAEEKELGGGGRGWRNEFWVSRRRPSILLITFDEGTIS